MKGFLRLMRLRHCRSGFFAVLLSSVFPLGWVQAQEGAAVPKIATLHPFLSEITRRLLSNEVEVVELLGPAGNPHTLDPKPGDLKRMQGARAIVAMGKNLEPYLGRVRTVLGEGTVILEAGRPVPSLVIDEKSDVFLCCPTHSSGALDPHWWHSPEAMRRAVRGLEKEFINLFPEKKDRIRGRSKAVQLQLKDLHRWAKLELSGIPSGKRTLVTAHAGFGYLCRAYGFRAIPVKGLAGQRAPTQAYLSETIALMRKHHVTAVFPEAHSNQGALDALRRETGAEIGPVLLTDNLDATVMSYEQFIQANISAIAVTLTPTAETEE